MKHGEDINGFVFNDIGNIIGWPTTVTVEVLQQTHATLIERKEYIAASRINNLLVIAEIGEVSALDLSGALSLPTAMPVILDKE